MGSSARRVRHEPFDVSSARMGSSARRPQGQAQLPNFAPHLTRNPENTERRCHPPHRQGKPKRRRDLRKSSSQRQSRYTLPKYQNRQNVRDPPTNVNTVTGTPRSPQDPQKPHGHWIDSPHRRREKRTRIGKEYPPQRVYIPRKTMERTKIETAKGESERPAMTVRR